MKFLHLADLHLGKRVNGFDLLEDQRYILEQILALCDSNKVDAVVLAGDIYDAPVPPAAACTLLDWFLTQLAARRIAVLAVSGNHDSAERLDYAAGLLANQNVYIAGQFRGAPRQIVLNDRFGPVEFTLLPFVRAATVRHYMPEADLPDYDGAPLCYHLDECGMEKSATLVRLGRRGVDGIDTLPLHPRRAMRHIVGPLAKLVEHPADTGDYIWATLTDPTPQPDAMAMLRTAYPNAMRLDYRPQGVEILPADTAQSVRGKPFASLFEDFFTQMNGRPLTVEEARAVKALREEASK